MWGRRIKPLGRRSLAVSYRMSGAESGEYGESAERETRERALKKGLSKKVYK